MLSQRLFNATARALSWTPVGKALEGGRLSFSQEGEDVLLWRIIGPVAAQEPGCYVDVGCNHPLANSNTAFFYRMGWRGVAIDPNGDYARLFAALRPQDVFINSGVGNATSGSYHRFDPPLYNTFDAATADSLQRSGAAKLVGVETMSIEPLADLLQGVWPGGRQLSLLSVDCEGMDSEVLATNDWSRFPSDWVCVELPDVEIADAASTPAALSLTRLGYDLFAKLHRSALFVRADRREHYRIARRAPATA